MPMPVSVTLNAPRPCTSTCQPSVIVPPSGVYRIALLTTLPNALPSSSRLPDTIAASPMSSAIVCRPLESALASADTSSSSGTTANEVSAPILGSLSRADSVSRSSTRRCMLLACSPISCRYCVRWWGSSSSSCSVSRKPLTTVSGVLSSCETLAMKSRRMRATASSCVMSRLISSRSSIPNGTTWIERVVAAPRSESTITASVKSPASK